MVSLYQDCKKEDILHDSRHEAKMVCWNAYMIACPYIARVTSIHTDCFTSLYDCRFLPICRHNYRFSCKDAVKVAYLYVCRFICRHAVWKTGWYVFRAVCLHNFFSKKGVENEDTKGTVRNSQKSEKQPRAKKNTSMRKKGCD